MADTAFATQYRADAIAAFEQKQSLLRSTVSTEVEIKAVRDKGYDAFMKNDALRKEERELLELKGRIGGK